MCRTDWQTDRITVANMRYMVALARKKNCPTQWVSLGFGLFGVKLGFLEKADGIMDLGFHEF